MGKLTIVTPENNPTLIARASAPAPAPSATIPVAPPRAWFDRPASFVADVTVEDSGRVYGYPAASWNDCHLSYPDQCVTPPRSVTDYGFFRVKPGKGVRTAEGDVVRTGPLTLKGGHADPSWSALRAMAHYDDTDSAFADVNIGEDEHGIWIAGALRPGTTPETIRTVMASGFSGDWRLLDGNLELIALSAVNTPGFHHRASVYEEAGMVASVILDMPRPDGGIPAPIVERVETVEVLDADSVLASAADRIAASIGRSKAQRRAALHKLVHGTQDEEVA